MENSELLAAAKRTLLDCMGIKKGERISILTDDLTREVGDAFYAASQELDTEPILAVMQPLRTNGQEPPESLLHVMSRTDVLMLATKSSLSHTQARRQATDAGVRCASMPGITAEMMTRTMNVDWENVAATTLRLVEKLHGVTSFHLLSAAGTDITIAMGDLQFEGDTGIYRKPGSFGNLPGGEACAAPAFRGSTGLAVFDGSFAGLGLLQTPVYVIFKDGMVESIDNGETAVQLKNMIAPFGAGGRMIAELGIGTHPTARLTGAVLEDDKIAGTVHMALGNNVGFGGTNNVAIHIDGVIMKPTLITDDGTKIIDNGKLLI
jgi:leucyl aminopeptidase (aminopeptidase T)